MNKDIVNKVLLNNATEQEAVEVATWLGDTGGQLMALDMIDADMENMVPHFDAVVCAERAEKKVNRWWRVAAVVAMVLTLGAGAMWLVPKMQQDPVIMQTVCTNRGEQVQVVLQDGTHIYLNADSRLEFPSVFSEKNRSISLTGEAYFEVQKDNHKPFLVELNGVSIEVLGTKFNVKAYENEQIQVNLDEGHVQFHSENQVVDMQAGECLSYDRDTRNTTLSHHVDTHMASAWKEHRLAVSEMSMQELKTMLERRYNVDIDIPDAQCYKYSYSIAVSDKDLRTVLQRMSSVSNIRYVYDEHKNKVKILAK